MQDRPYCIAKQPIRHHRRHGAGKPLWLSRLRHKADKETTFTETSAITVAWRLRGGTYTTAATPRVTPAARTLNARTAWRRRPTGGGMALAGYRTNSKGKTGETGQTHHTTISPQTAGWLSAYLYHAMQMLNARTRHLPNLFISTQAATPKPNTATNSQAYRV